MKRETERKKRDRESERKRERRRERERPRPYLGAYRINLSGNQLGCYLSVVTHA